MSGAADPHPYLERLLLNCGKDAPPATAADLPDIVQINVDRKVFDLIHAMASDEGLKESDIIENAITLLSKSMCMLSGKSKFKATRQALGL